MSFDQHMIIDATTGNLARFVNHSCNPNCRMIKWIVSGQPRMALFAGDRPIMTGDELTYDYNFDPFSQNVQKCLCGEENCRGVLGPRPRDGKSAKVELNKTIKATVKAGKRKLKELIGADAYEFDEDDDDDDEKNKTNNKTNKNADNSSKKTKKRKISATTGLKKSLSTASLKAAKGAASALKKSVSSIGLKSKKKTATRTTKSTAAAHHRVSTGGAIKKTTTTTTTTSKIKRTKPVKKQQQKKASGDRLAQMSSRDSGSMTIVASVADGTTEPANKGRGKSKSKASPTSSKRTISVSTDVSLQRPSLETRRRIIKPSPKAKANASL